MTRIVDYRTEDLDMHDPDGITRGDTLEETYYKLSEIAKEHPVMVLIQTSKNHWDYDLGGNTYKIEVIKNRYGNIGTINQENRMKKEPGWEKVGTIDVDAGMIWLGDPCYILQDKRDSEERNKDCITYNELLDLLFKDDINGPNTLSISHKKDKGEGLGVVVSSGYGDGTYNVYVKTKNGRVMEVKAVFEEENEEDEEVYDEVDEE